MGEKIKGRRGIKPAIMKEKKVTTAVFLGLSISDFRERKFEPAIENPLAKRTAKAMIRTI